MSDWSGRLLLGTAVFTSVTFNTHVALALGTVGFDSSNFVYSSNVRGTSSTSVDAKIEGQADTKIFHLQGDFQIDTYVTANPNSGYNSKQAFISTQKDLLPNQEVTVGRRYFEWSKLDQAWSMMSLWSPRYTWDEIHPETVGLTGVFYEFKNHHVQLLAYGSPIAIPELGSPTENSNNQLTSSNPLFRPPPTSMQYLKKDTAIEYHLVTPSLQQILLRPNFALRFRAELESGYWFSANTGVMPVNMVQLAAAPFFDATTGNINVNIFPQFPMRNINTFETGYGSKDKSWNLWFSGSYEQPFQFQNQKNWLNPVITDTTIVSTGSDFAVSPKLTFSTGALFIHEAPFTHAGDLPNVNISLPTRFPLKKGIKVGSNYRFNDYTQTEANLTQDIVEKNKYVSFDVKHHFRQSNVQIGGGADLFLTDTTTGWVGQYYGDDRIRGWLRYAF